jgi:hypothetical protein
MTASVEELVIPTARGAASTNGSAATTEEIEQQAQAIMASYEKKLVASTAKYQQQLAELTAKVQGAGEATDPVTSHFGITYQWWNLLMLGPFQQVAPLGPFRPSKIIRAGEPAFMIAALWRNPLPLPGGPNPSAAQIMAPFRYRIRGEVVNLSTVQDGIDYAPVTNTFGGGFINLHVMNVPAPSSVPAEGQPVLVEANFTVDILGAGLGLPPFAGYATWLLDPDNEPPFVFPFIPGVGPVVVPGSGPRLQHDIPARYLFYV